MEIEDLTEEKNLIRIAWLVSTASSTSTGDESDTSSFLATLLQNYLIRNDLAWLDLWMAAAKKYAETGDMSQLLLLMDDATVTGRLISKLEEDPKFKNKLN